MHLGIRRYTQHYSLCLALGSGLLALSSFNFAFDNQAWAQTQAMKQFLSDFGDFDKTIKAYAFPTYFTSLFNGLIFVGQGCGVMIGSMISSRYGRRWCVFVMSLWSMISAIVVLTARSKWQLLAARIMNQGYVGMEVASIPVYQAEIMPPPVRGVAVASYQMSIALGGLVINLICRGTSELSGSSAWKIPFGLFFVVPCIECVNIFLLPESPRWLLSKDQIEEARHSLTRLRVDKSPTAIDNEIESIILSLEVERDNGSYADLFRGVNMRRTALAWSLFFLLQGTGEAFASRYQTIYVSSLHSVNPFTVSCITFTGNTVASILCMALSDVVGRRPILLTGIASQAVALFVLGGMGTTQEDTPQKAVIVAAIVIYAVSYNGIFAPTLYISITELPEQKLRDKTQRTGGVIAVVVNFAVSFSLPYIINPGYGNLGMRFAFIFAPICVLGWIFIFCKFRTGMQRPLIARGRPAIPAPDHGFAVSKLASKEHRAGARSN